METNIDMYKTQLSQVTAALSNDPGNQELVQLAEDLKQLIELTEQSLLEQKKQLLLDQVEQMEQVQEPEPEQQHVDEASDGQEDLKDSLKDLIGMKCQAPFRSLHGTSYHNGIIFQVHDHHDEDGDVSVAVAFSHPTTLEMVPCKYYLEGTCQRGTSCKYSHGETVRVSRLKEYKDSDHSSLGEGITVLAKAPDRSVWDHAVVETVEDGSVYVRFSHDHSSIQKLPLEHVLPLEPSEEEEEEDDDDINVLEGTFAPVDMLDGISGSSSALGEWEKHTNGVASKLMAKMGYVFGAGLGKKGEGRVEPVPAIIYPAGKSLDWCMESREKKGVSKSGMSVEAFMKKQKAKNNISKTSENTDVFDFINKTLVYKKSSPLVPSASVDRNQSKNKSKHQSSNDKQNNKLNSFHLNEELRRSQKEIEKLKVSYDRLKSRDPSSAQVVLQKLRKAEARLKYLGDQDKKISMSNDKEKDNKKFLKF